MEENDPPFKLKFLWARPQVRSEGFEE